MIDLSVINLMQHISTRHQPILYNIVYLQYLFARQTHLEYRMMKDTTYMSEACCTCATLLSNVSPEYDEKTEKPKAYDRELECCGRIICGNCINVS